jgi:hypothetical protein
VPEPRRIHVHCPKCHVVYRLHDDTLLPIARCGRCRGGVISERAAADPREQDRVVQKAA